MRAIFQRHIDHQVAGDKNSTAKFGIHIRRHALGGVKVDCHATGQKYVDIFVQRQSLLQLLK